jgi:hypothetical protein
MFYAITQCITGGIPDIAFYEWGLCWKGSLSLHTWWVGMFLKKKFFKILVALKKMFTFGGGWGAFFFYLLQV